MTGRTPARALVVFVLAASSMLTDFAAITLSKTLVIKASVSISTFVSFSVYYFSISSVIALKKSWVVSVVEFKIYWSSCKIF